MEVKGREEELVPSTTFVFKSYSPKNCYLSPEDERPRIRDSYPIGNRNHSAVPITLRPFGFDSFQARSRVELNYQTSLRPVPVSPWNVDKYKLKISKGQLLRTFSRFNSFLFCRQLSELQRIWEVRKVLRKYQWYQLTGGCLVMTVGLSRWEAFHFLFLFVH